MTPQERLSLAGRIVDIRGMPAESSGDVMLLRDRQVAVLRRRIREADGAMDPSDVIGIVDGLEDEVQRLRSSMPDGAEKTRRAAFLAKSLVNYDSYYRILMHGGHIDEAKYTRFQDLLVQLRSMAESTADSRSDEFRGLAASGAEVLPPPDAARAAKDVYSAAIARRDEAATAAYLRHFSDPASEYAKARDRKAELIAFYERHVGIDAPERGKTMADRDALRERYRSMVEAHNARMGEARRVATEAYNADMAGYEGELKQAREGLEAAGRAILDGVLSKSTIAQVEADAWAARQRIDQGVIERLRALQPPYTEDSLRADMAEFYRLCGGMLGDIGMKLAPGDRSSADGVHGVRRRWVNVGARFNKRVLFHELAHFLEFDPRAVSAAIGFIEHRRTSASLKALKRIVPKGSYRKDEVAYEDKWVDPYVGKWYDGTCTEVMSMGFEAFSDPMTLAHRYAQDPQHTALAAGFAVTGTDPQFDRFRRSIDSLLDEKEARAEAAEAEKEAAIAVLSKGVKWAKPADNGTRFMSASQELRDLLAGSLYEGRIRKFLGEFGGVAAWYGDRVKNPATWRYGKGYILVRLGGDPDNSDIGRIAGDSKAERFVRATAAAWSAMPPSGMPDLNDPKTMSAALAALAAKGKTK